MGVPTGGGSIPETSRLLHVGLFVQALRARMGANCILEGVYEDLGAVSSGHLSRTSSYLWILFTLSVSPLIL